jgi:hypothetical protein
VPSCRHPHQQQAKSAARRQTAHRPHRKSGRLSPSSWPSPVGVARPPKKGPKALWGRATPSGEGQDGGLRPRVLARASRSSEATRGHPRPPEATRGHPPPPKAQHRDPASPSVRREGSSRPSLAPERVVTPPGLEPEPLGPKPSVLPITPRGTASPPRPSSGVSALASSSLVLAPRRTIRRGTASVREAPYRLLALRICNTPRSRGHRGASMGFDVGHGTRRPGSVPSCWVGRSDVHSEHARNSNAIVVVVTPPGLEPGMVEPESTVLPITPRGIAQPVML